MTNAEAFIGTMTGELRKLAEERDFWPLIPSLTNEAQTAKAMKRARMRAELVTK